MRISDWSSDVCSSDLNTLQSFVACPIDHGIKQAVLVAEQIVHRRERAARSLADRIYADALVSLFEEQRFGRVLDGLPPFFSSCVRMSTLLNSILLCSSLIPSFSFTNIFSLFLFFFFFS